MRRSALAPVALLLSLTLFISARHAGLQSQTAPRNHTASTPAKETAFDPAVPSICRHRPGRYGLNIPFQVAQVGGNYFTAQDLVAPSGFNVCLYDKSLDPVLQQLRSALVDSDARWEHEYAGAACTQKYRQAFQKHGGTSDPETVNGLTCPAWPTVHHDWITRQLYVLDGFKKTSSYKTVGPGMVNMPSSMGTGRAGLVFVGPNSRTATDPVETLLWLKQIDESWRVDHEKFIDLEGWHAVVQEQESRNTRAAAPADSYKVHNQNLELEIQFDRETKALHDELNGRMALASSSPLWIASDIAAPPSGGGIFLYAKTALGYQSIEELYVGVPTIVEVQFDDPNSATQVSVDISVSGQKLSLQALRYDKGGYIFRTDAFIPTAQAEDQGPTFNPASPPKGGAR